MRILVLGGTRFIGLALVEELLAAGHTVAIVHRGEHEPDLPPTVEHIHAPRHDLPARRDELARFAADAAIDLSAMTAPDAEAALAALDPGVRLVAASSIESYRVFDSIYAGTVTDAVPLREDAPLRSGPTPPPSRRSGPVGTTRPRPTTSSRSSASTWSAGPRCAGSRWPTARGTTSAVRTSSSPASAPAAPGSRSAPPPS